MDDSLKLLVFNNAGLSIKRLEKLKNLDFSINAGDFIGIYGLNGSGKSILSELIGGKIKPDTGMLHGKKGLRVAVVSSAEQNRMLDEERYNDDTEFMEGKIDPGRSVRNMLKPYTDKSCRVAEIRNIIEAFGLQYILERGIKFLSTGEFRKMMIVRALLSCPDIIVLDDPYTGLDLETRSILEKQIPDIRDKTGALVLISGRLNDIAQAERFFFLNDMTMHEYEDLSVIEEICNNQGEFINVHREERAALKGRRENHKAVELIRMSGAGMSYYDEKILADINWTVKTGEHWQLIGPNGSGKSSLLSLVNGDSPKAYGQEIYLFGRKRGSGETVWEIKQRIGYVSGMLQGRHRISQSVLSVVVSGFFDSIGLYDKPDPIQIEKARQLSAEFGVEKYLDKKFDSLSEGMKRAVLIIRAMVKHPEVLILDEPCQGLDDKNSGLVIAVAEHILENDHSTLLYVSHDPLYRMNGITNIIKLVPHPEGGYTGVIKNYLR